MIIQIQQTAALVLVVCVALIRMDGRTAETTPYWKVAAVTVPAILSAVVLVFATAIRIWS